MRKEVFLSYTMTTADANKVDGVVSVGRQFDFLGDAETELMILRDGDESLCLGYDEIKFYDDVYAGDHMNYHGTLLKEGNTSRLVLVQAFKLATPAARLGIKGAKPTDLVWFDEPRLVSEGTVTMVVRKEKQRGWQPDGTVKDPWRDLD